MAVGFHEIPRTRDAAVLADEERGADDADPAARALAPRAVSVVHLPVHVAQQPDAQPVLLGERAMRCRVAWNGSWAMVARGLGS